MAPATLWPVLRPAPRPFLGGRQPFAPRRTQRITGGPPWIERFDQTPSTLLGPDLAWTETTGNLQTVGNACRPVATSIQSEARAEHAVTTADMYAQADVVAFDQAARSIVDVCARYSASARTFYLVRMDSASPGHGGTQQVQLWKRVAATPTLLESVASTQAAPFTLRIEVDGTTLRGFVNESLVISDTDSDITAGTRGGISLFTVTAVDDAQVDDFEVGDLVGAASVGALAQTLAPLQLSSTATLPITGVTAATLGALILTAHGGSGVGILGAVGVTLGPLTGQATGTLALRGQAAGALGSLAVTAAGTLPITGALAQTLGPLTLAASESQIGPTGPLIGVNRLVGV